MRKDEWRKVEKAIAANSHSLSETVRYAKDKYGLIETNSIDREYIEQVKCLKESLTLQNGRKVIFL